MPRLNCIYSPLLLVFTASAGTKHNPEDDSAYVSNFGVAVEGHRADRIKAMPSALRAKHGSNSLS